MPRRVVKASPDAEPGLEVGENAARLSGSRNSFFFADDSGCYLVGNLSFLAEPQNMRIASMYTFPTAYRAALPSTTYNPRPMLTPNPPVEGFTSLATEVARLLGELI